METYGLQTSNITMPLIRPLRLIYPIRGHLRQTTTLPTSTNRDNWPTNIQSRNYGTPSLHTPISTDEVSHQPRMTMMDMSVQQYSHPL